MADDKQEGTPDPWAGLEAAGEGDTNEEFAMSFDGLEPEAVAAEPAAVIEDRVDDTLDDGLDSFAAEVVVEDDIADWLEAPAAETKTDQPLSDAVAEPEFAASVFADPAAAEAEVEDTTEAGNAFPVVGGDIEAAEEEQEEAEAEAETLRFAADAVYDGDLDHDATEMDASEFDAGGLGVAEPEELIAELESDEADLEPGAVLAIGGSTVVRAESKPKARKRSGGGAFGPIIGGLLSVPIVFLILLGLLWGTGRDPIGMRSWAPSFLLPTRQGEGAVAAAMSPDAKAASLDDLAAVETDAGEAPDSVSDRVKSGGPSTESVPLPSAEVAGPPLISAVEPVLPTPEISLEPALMVNVPPAPSIEDPLLAVVPVGPSVPGLEPATAVLPGSPAVDVSGLEAAVDAALASMDVVAESGEGPPGDRRRALVAWYKDLARVGTELSMLETAAADSGRPLDETPEPVVTLYGRLGSAGGLAPDLKRLCRNWVDYAKRPADGVLLVGLLDAARQVGPFWYTTLSLEQVDGSLRTVSLISRREPRAEPGDRVAVAGVVFSEDTVWAADCGRLDAVAAVEDDPF